MCVCIGDDDDVKANRSRSAQELPTGFACVNQVSSGSPVQSTVSTQYTVFPRLIPHPRLVPQCGTIQIQTTLNSVFILIVTHPRIIPHDSMKNRILLLKNYKTAKQSIK